MGRTVLVTGSTGALGPHLVSELLHDPGTDRVIALVRAGRDWSDRCRDLESTVVRLGSPAGPRGELQGAERRNVSGRLAFASGDVSGPDGRLTAADGTDLTAAVNVIVHAAANTTFGAPATALRVANVEGTQRMVALARRCRRLEQFLFVSTVHVSGTRTGEISERLSEPDGPFVNAYEQTKCEAEHLVVAAAVPARIARLSSCLGRQNGYVHRFGAIHQCLHWLTRGLVPMVPGSERSRVDVIDADTAACWIARAASRPVAGVEICHVAAGAQAPLLSELIHVAIDGLRQRCPRWIEAPLIVDAETYAMFEATVAQSRDTLFAHVCRVTQSFLPTLLYPKVYETRQAEALWGGALPLADWRATLRNVIGFGCERNWRRSRNRVNEYV